MTRDEAREKIANLYCIDVYGVTLECMKEIIKDNRYNYGYKFADQILSLPELKEYFVSEAREAIREAIRELEYDLSNGRIVKKDLEAALAKLEASSPSIPKPT